MLVFHVVLHLNEAVAFEVADLALKLDDSGVDALVGHHLKCRVLRFNY